jgi:hypothetical protein
VGGYDRMTNASHVMFGSADILKAETAELVACVQCHTDHRGRSWELAKVDDRECASCHMFSTFTRHPQFAAIRAGITTGLGMKFDHDRHLIEVTDAGLDQCAGCHVPTVDQTAFEPIVFDAHCGACHLDDEGFVTGKTDPIALDLILAPGQIPDAGIPGSNIEVTEAARGRVEFGRMLHRDPWTLYNARRLRRAVDPDGEAARRSALRGQIAFLEQRLASRPFSAATRAELEAWEESLGSQLAALEAAGDSPPAGGGGAALETMAGATRQLGSELLAVLGGEDEDAQALAGSEVLLNLENPQGGDDPQGESLFEARRDELVSLLDAIEARGDEQLRVRAEELRQRVLAASPAQSDEPDTDAYREGLLKLDELFRVVRDVPDSEARLQAAELGVLRDFGRQSVTGGLSLDEFQERRRQLLSLLNAVSRTGDATQGARAETLEQRVLALSPGADGPASRRRIIGQRQKSLDRVHLELELLRDGEEPPLRMAAPDSSSQETRAELERLRVQLAELSGISRPGVALTNEEQERLGFTLDSLLTPCVKCHELSGAELAPVTIAEPVMERARFDHAPHVIQAGCASCHASVATSGLATDINVPGVESCASCHRPSDARADCGTCHVYHPPSVAEMLGHP